MDGNEEIRNVISAFQVEGEVTGYAPHGNGHINDTFLVRSLESGKERLYILQRINRRVFQDSDLLMQNIKGVTDYMRERIEERGGDVHREVLNLVPGKDGGLYYRDCAGDDWRMFLFVEGSVSLEKVENPADFYRSGRAFGHFLMLLDGYPMEKLGEILPGFHDTPARLRAFRRAVEEDVCGRRGGVSGEIAFVLQREAETGVVMDLVRRGELPLRVTHNDTKLNNILFDAGTGEALCVVDLDTVMPGPSVFDFGDSIRFGANTGAEDEKDLGKISLSLELFESYTRGFLEGCEGKLTPTEIRMLPMGAKLMTLECGMRFLADYLQGDVYFHTSYADHNLDRCRTQLALVADMERKWEDMEKIVAKYGGVRLP